MILSWKVIQNQSAGRNTGGAGSKSEKLHCHQVQGGSVEPGLQGTACGQMGGWEARGGLEREEDVPLGHGENHFVRRPLEV